MMRVLLVDDCRDIRFLLRTELEWMGYEVHSAADAKTAVEIAEEGPPDVIVSDLRMPGIDGFEFIKRIRQSRRLTGVPAIALTGATMPKEVQQALVMGFTAHLVKPVSATELAQLIDQLMAKRLERKAGWSGRELRQ